MAGRECGRREANSKNWDLELSGRVGTFHGLKYFIIVWGGVDMSHNDELTGQEWLRARMSELGLGSITDLEVATGINKGTLSRYFRQIQRPSIDVIPVLCKALDVSPETLLRAFGVVVTNQ